MISNDDKTIKYVKNIFKFALKYAKCPSNAQKIVRDKYVKVNIGQRIVIQKYINSDTISFSFMGNPICTLTKCALLIYDNDIMNYLELQEKDLHFNYIISCPTIQTFSINEFKDMEYMYKRFIELL